MNKCSYAVEILPSGPIEIMTGSIKGSTFRVDKQGRNMVMPKVEQPNKTGRDSLVVKGAPEKWKTLSQDKKQYWDEIAAEHDFRSRWTAFVSSFFLSVDLHGLEHTMNHELTYIHSKNRGKSAEHFENSLKRRLKYKPDPRHYKITQTTLETYPIELRSPFIFVKLLDLNEVNNALRCKMVCRTDPIVEHEYFPFPDSDGDIGTFIKITRPRLGDEVYELFDYFL